MKPIHDALSELDRKILALINEALAEGVVSYSNFNNIVTGNAYQSVLLGDAETSGFRKRDATLFAGVPLKGKRLVDLGCNLGEKTRLAVLAGAAYAEGIEYEDFFVRIGGLINVSSQVVNAVLRQGDVTRAGCVTSDFDVGACFSAFVYVEQNLEEILSHIRNIFILETHALDESWYGNYVQKVEPLLPYWVVLGFTDHGTGLDTSFRALLAFGRDTETVDLIGVNRCDELKPDHADVRILDVAQSRRAWSMWGNAERTKMLFAGLRTKLMSLQAPAPNDILTLLRSTLPGLAALCDAYNLPGTHFGTDHYWLHFLRGLVTFIDVGKITSDNPYLLFLRRLSATGGYDPGMSYELADESRAIQRLSPRMARFVRVLCDRSVEKPLLVYNPFSLPSLEAHGYQPSDEQMDEHVLYTDGRAFRIQFIDGNHRLAGLWLSGAKHCPILPIWTNIYGLSQKNYNLFPDTVYQDAIVRKILAENVLAAPSTAATLAG
jgi:hypothetical protein